MNQHTHWLRQPCPSRLHGRPCLILASSPCGWLIIEYTDTHERAAIGRPNLRRAGGVA